MVCHGQIVLIISKGNEVKIKLKRCFCSLMCRQGRRTSIKRSLFKTGLHLIYELCLDRQGFGNNLKPVALNHVRCSALVFEREKKNGEKTRNPK